MHWGLEYQRHPSQAQRALAARLFEAGADVIIGSHPHVTQDLRFWTSNEAPGGSSGADEGARLVAYSLGNFVFDQGGEDVSQGMALRLLLDQGGLRAAQALPVWAGLRPGLMVPGEASALLERILPVQRQGFACTPQGCTPVDAPQDASTGAFFSGAIDLTGDGAPENVRRQGASATIYQDGELAWQSPPEWQVLDLALGDPNDDGRSELLLALE